MPRRSPVRGQIYTVREIITELKLRDSPFFTAVLKNPLDEETTVVIQTSEVDDDNKLVDLMGNHEYKYIRETEEWIPIFRYQGTEEEFLKVVDVTVDLNPFMSKKDPVGLHVTPKGFECDQYYKLAFCPTRLVDNFGTDYHVPSKLYRALKKTGQIQ